MEQAAPATPSVNESNFRIVCDHHPETDTESSTVKGRFHCDDGCGEMYGEPAAPSAADQPSAKKSAAKPKPGPTANSVHLTDGEKRTARRRAKAASAKQDALAVKAHEALVKAVDTVLEGHQLLQRSDIFWTA